MRPIDADALKQMIDFRMWDVDDDYPHDEASNRISEDHAVKKIIDEMPTIDAEPQWIPVSERLPKDNKTKIVQIKGINVVEAGYYSNGDWWCISSAGTLSILEVVAWMELPEPYGSEE